MVAKIFSHSVIVCLLILLIVSFSAKKLLSLSLCCLLIFALIVCAFGIMSKKKLLPRPISRRLIPKFSSTSFMVSELIFESLICFELFLVRLWSSFIVLRVCLPFSQRYLLNELLFPQQLFLDTLLKVSWLYMPELDSGLPSCAISPCVNFVPVPYCLYYFGFRVQSEIQEFDTSDFVFCFLRLPCLFGIFCGSMQI